MKQYQVGHLLLLVGSNPVPNAVAGKLLVKSGGTITLICSMDSLTIAQRLKSWFEKDGITVREPNDSQVDPTNPSTIFPVVTQALGRANIQRVGLNYTGGTKAMSVHAYRAVESWCKNIDCNATFSYLDASKLQMVFDSKDLESGQHVARISVATKVGLKLQELLQLHGWSLKTEPAINPQLPMSALVLLNAHTNDKASKDWFIWIASLEEHARKPNNEWQNKELHDKPLSWGELHKHDALNQFIEQLSQESGTDQSKHLDFAALKANGKFAKTKHIPEWLHGKWLEHALLQILQQQQSALQLHDCMHNVVPNEVEFDVDVVAMRGYQLFAFSCSTSSQKSLLKQKLFEAATRARQLGGDEACTALICLYEDASKLQKEVRDILNENNESERIKVFGRRELVNFSGEVENWIKRQCNAQ